MKEKVITRCAFHEMNEGNPAFMRVARFIRASRGQSNTDPQNLEKGTREDGRKSIPKVFIPVRLISISGFEFASADPAE